MKSGTMKQDKQLVQRGPEQVCMQIWKERVNSTEIYIDGNKQMFLVAKQHLQLTSNFHTSYSMIDVTFLRLIPRIQQILKHSFVVDIGPNI